MKRYDRRTFLKLSGASAVMLALAACDDSCSSGSTSSGSATETPPSPPIPVIRDGQKILTIFNAELARRKVENIKFEYSKGLEHDKCFAAVVLAAALLLTGCGGAAAPAAPARLRRSFPKRRSRGGADGPERAHHRPVHAGKERFGRVGGGQRCRMHVSVHVPQLECDSPDAASINDELNAIYAADFREYEN